MTKRKRVVMARLNKLDSPATKEFDKEFWSHVSAQGKFEALFEMILHAFMLKGKNAHQFRLQRNVQNIIRREG